MRNRNIQLLAGRFNSILAGPIQRRLPNSGGLRAPIAMFFLVAVSAVLAHPDLLLQIDQLNQRIDDSRPDVELLLKRANLHRRHGDWEAAEQDFDTARTRFPDRHDIDWLEGLMLVDAGRLEEAEPMLTRYLEGQPHNASALQARARARSGMGLHVDAASDYGSAIEHGDNPSPVLYSARTREFLAAGESYMDSAAATTAQGLEKFPNEVGLIGLDADIALALGQESRAIDHVYRLPAALSRLPQWRYRLALAWCLQDRPDVAADAFENLLDDKSSNRAGTWRTDRETVRDLAAEPNADECKKVALNRLQTLAAGS